MIGEERIIPVLRSVVFRDRDDAELMLHISELRDDVGGGEVEEGEILREQIARVVELVREPVRSHRRAGDAETVVFVGIDVFDLLNCPFEWMLVLKEDFISFSFKHLPVVLLSNPCKLMKRT